MSNKSTFPDESELVKSINGLKVYLGKRFFLFSGWHWYSVVDDINYNSGQGISKNKFTAVKEAIKECIREGKKNKK